MSPVRQAKEEASGGNVCQRRRLGFDQQPADDFVHLLYWVRVVQSAPGVEAVQFVTDGYLAVDDAGTHRAEYFAKFGLRPNRAEAARACADDCDWLVADGVRRYRS